MTTHVKCYLPGKVIENEPRLFTGGESQTTVSDSHEAGAQAFERTAVRPALWSLSTQKQLE